MFHFENIADFQKQLAEGSTNCLTAVDHFLSIIDKNKKLNAFVEVYHQEARDRARQLDQKRELGGELQPLHGVVVAIKDVICYAGHNVSAGSSILKGFKSLFSSNVVKTLLDADAIIIGVCNCDEFAMGSTNEYSAYGPTLNALDTSKVSGGSSGGSAVAVQAGCCMVSLGTDTGGSVRQPASFCGIVGFKPTYGRISRNGIIAYASSFDQVGIFALNTSDVAMVLEIIAHPDALDSTMLQTPPPENIVSTVEGSKKFNFCYLAETMDHPGLDDNIRRELLNYFGKLQKNGHTVTRIDFDYLQYIVPAYYVLTTAEASSNLSRYDGIRFGLRCEGTNDNLDEFYKKTRSEGFGWEVKKRILLGTFVLSTGFYDAYFSKAQKIRRLLLEKVTSIFSKYDGILMPVTPSTAYDLGMADKDPVSMYIGDIYTVFANLTGLPAISLPLFLHDNNMPFGLQLVANHQDDITLLRISLQLFDLEMREQITP